MKVVSGHWKYSIKAHSGRLIEDGGSFVNGHVNQYDCVEYSMPFPSILNAIDS